MDLEDSTRVDAAYIQLFSYAHLLRQMVTDGRLTQSQAFARLVKKISQGSAPTEAAILRGWGIRGSNFTAPLPPRAV